MFVTDLCKDFYTYIVDKRIAVFVGFDVDALCACKILQYQLQCDHVVHSLIPVSGVRDLEAAFREHVGQVKTFVLINCGANINLIDVLQPDDEDVVFFVADSHRPVDIYNVYNASQVRLLMTDIDSDEFPALETIHREDDDDDDEDEDELEQDNDDDNDDEGQSEERVTKRRRLDDIVQRKIARRTWEKEREKILFEYNQFAYYGPSTSLIFFDIAWKMSKDNNDILWWASIGLTESLVNHKIDQSDYILQAGSLQSHVSRLNHRTHDNTDDGSSGDHHAESSSVHSLKITFDKDLQLALYRHWSLYQSFKYTAYTACQFRLWTHKGKKKLCEFLADIGLPLVQCKQHFTSMDMYLRNNVKSWIETKMEKYGLEQIVNGSFFGQFSFRHKFCASDFVYAASALLEAKKGGSKMPKDNLLDALACLSRHNLTTIDRGIDAAKRQMSAIFQQVQTFLDLNLVISAGPFLYAVVTEGAPGTSHFSRPICLTNLAHCLLRAHVATSRNRKSRTLPLVLVSPSFTESVDDCDGNSGDDGTERTSTTQQHQLIVGIPPLSEESPRNFFGQAFLQAGLAARASIVHDHFDPCIVQISPEYNGAFFDSLTSILG